MKKKIMIGLIIFLLIGTIALVIWNNSKSKYKPEDTFITYMQHVSEKQYENMYELLSKDSKEKISQEDFIKRNKNIYQGIEITNLEIVITTVNKIDDNTIEVIYANNMNTMSGGVHFSNTVRLVKEEENYKIKWSSNLIFPNLNNDDKVRVSTLAAKRGDILDRKGEKLATDGIASQIGLVPGKMSENKEEDIRKNS